MRYYKYGSKSANFALDDKGNAFKLGCEGWQSLEEVPRLTAMIELDNAFPKGAKKSLQDRIYSVLATPFRLIGSLLCRVEEKGAFTLIACLVVVVLVFFGVAMGTIIGLPSSSDKGGIPKAIIVEYLDGTKLQYPIENCKPIEVHVR